MKNGRFVVGDRVIVGGNAYDDHHDTTPRVPMRGHLGVVSRLPRTTTEGEYLTVSLLGHIDHPHHHLVGPWLFTQDELAYAS